MTIALVSYAIPFQQMFLSFKLISLYQRTISLFLHNFALNYIKLKVDYLFKGSKLLRSGISVV